MFNVTYELVPKSIQRLFSKNKNILSRSDGDYYVGSTVRELCLTRSADFILDTAELNLLIHHLCTS